MLRRILVSALLGLAAGRIPAENPPPKAPAGFAWKNVASIKAAFLLPDGWFFKEELRKDVRGIFLSKENIDQKGKFDTGLTINVFKNKKDAPARARQYIAEQAQVGDVVNLWEAENGALKLYGARLHITRDPPAFTEHVLAIGNSKTDTLYILMFESPDATWDEAWKKGEVILGNFRLDDEI
ncbi:MAG TPA: hypothetical protein VGO79_14730 [Thermoanaerobaculia bacterium]|jgi:hypothetical protein